MDVTSSEAVDAAAAQVLAAYGRVDILINSAGVVTGKRFADLTEADVQRTFDVNVFALYRTARAFLPGMHARNHKIDPLEIIDEYGADALRFMLLSGITPGNDTRFLEDRLISARNFANKLWNASRFVMMNVKGEDNSFLPMTDIKLSLERDLLKSEDKWIISRINEAVKDITGNMDKFELSLAEQKVYDLIWNEYCDWYIELVKQRLYGENEEDKAVCRGVLIYALSQMLKLLHPFMPFITEEIWSFIPDGETAADNQR